MASPQKVHHDGREYVVSPLTQEKKDEFSEAMKARAMKAALNLKRYGDLTEAEYHEAYALALDRVTAGAFDFHTPFTQDALKTHAGVTLLASILFGVSEREMLELFVAKGDEVRAALDVVLKGSVADPPKAE